MADTTEGNEAMEVEDASESAASRSAHTEKNEVTDEDASSKDLKTTNETDNEAENVAASDSMSTSNDVTGAESTVSEDKEDLVDNASKSPDEALSENSKVEKSRKCSGGSGPLSKKRKISDVAAEDDNAESGATMVDAIPSPAVLLEKQTTNTPEVDSPKPSLHEVLAEASPKNSPETITSGSSPFVKDRSASNDSVKAKNDKENESNEKPSAVDATRETSNTKEKENETESKEKSKSSKKKKNKICAECKMKKKLPLRISFQGEIYQLCSEDCYKNFKEKKTVKPAVPLTILSENCAQCKTKLEKGTGYLSAIGEVKALCSEECVKRYHEVNDKPKNCNQCKKKIESVYNRLIWETMSFCNEECLGNYQSFNFGSHCTCCQSPVHQLYLGKYCVCFGSEIRQFCSVKCLDEFKKGLKVCCFCQTDLSSGGEGFLAPVGDKGQFKDFCSQQCMERYEVVNNGSKSLPSIQECAHCKKKGSFKIQVKHGDKTYYLCCDNCVAGFRCSNQITDNMCGTCFKFFVPNENESFYFTFEGTPKHFCTKSCMTLFALTNRKLFLCAQCKVKKYNFDMIEKVDPNNTQQMFCSLNCLSLYRVNQTGSSTKNVRCDHCTKFGPTQYHLTMSDNSSRCFCNYDCVVAFQNSCVPPNQSQNAGSIPLVNITRQVNAKPVSTKGPNPVIANVISLAQTRPVSSPPNRSITVKDFLEQRYQEKASKTPSSSTQEATSTLTYAQPNNGVSKELVMKPNIPKNLKNKAASCKPLMQNKGICVKSQMCHKAIQTDDTRMPSILPIPFPVYLPSPVQMYTRTVPVPMPFPVPIPIPVPIFIKEKSSSKTSEADLLNVATTSAECMKIIAESSKTLSNMSQNLSISTMGASTSQEEPTNHIPGSEKEPEATDQLLKAQEQNVPQSSKEQEVPPQAPILQEEGISQAPNLQQDGISQAPILQKESTSRPLVESENVSMPTLVEKGNSAAENNSTAMIAPKIEPVDEDTPVEAKPHRKKKRSGEDIIMAEVKKSRREDDLEYAYGVNAWRQWAISKNSNWSRASAKKFKGLKTELLQMTPSEINFSLSCFVKEVVRPTTGQPYTAGALFYMLLGIQSYLNDNGRTDDIFSDEAYSSFAEHFHDVLLQYETRALGGEVPWSRIKEEFLWSSRQLGAQSPQILLNTLIFFNTKYFKMRTTASHMNLNFSHILRHTNNAGSYLRYHGPSRSDVAELNVIRAEDGKDGNKENNLIQPENNEDQLRCPVRLFEFYLSKCPPRTITNDAKFYCEVAENFSPSDKYWFTDIPLKENAIEQHLCRIQYIEEVGINLIQNGTEFVVD